MKHVIIGNGNLGNSIATELLKRNNTKQENNIIKIFSTSNGWKYPTSLDPIYDEIPMHVWVTVGAGSVEQAKANYLPFIDLHIKLPIELAQNLNDMTYLHVFSTDYVLDKRLDNWPMNRSLYALSKDSMEEALTFMDRPKTCVYRVGSLYGTHKPNKCFPYKLKKNSLKNEPTLPINFVTPTPTDWLASVLISNLPFAQNSMAIFNVAPEGCVSVVEWGSLILDKKIKESGIDISRPANSEIGCDLPHQIKNTWLDLWKDREHEWKEILSKIG